MIITEQKECENIIKNSYYSILNNFKYKKILNDFYKPDKYLFFTDGIDTIPLVIKNKMVTFYGGIHYNEYNLIPKNKILLNETLKYLQNANLEFKLLSITNDYFYYLEEKNKRLDVPYSTTWVFEDINNFDQKVLLSKFSAKKRYKINRILKQKDDYNFEFITYDYFKQNIEHFLKLHIDYFNSRGLKSGWEDKKELFSKIMDYFNEKENIFIKLIKKNGQEIGLYILVYNNNEMIYIFGGSFDKNDENISMLIYFDILENAKNIANKNNIKKLDAMRGSFGYKKKLNFKPKALYALVNDKNWIPTLDKNLTNCDYKNIYGRAFGIFYKEVLKK